MGRGSNKRKELRLGRCEFDARVGFFVTEIQAAHLPQYGSIGIADTCTLQIENVPFPVDVYLLGQVGGVDGQSVVGHAILVEQLVMHHQYLSEVGIKGLEFEVPHLYALLQSELFGGDFAQCSQQVRAGEEHLAFVAHAGAGEEILRQIYQLIVRNDRFVFLAVPGAERDVLAGLPPNTFGEPGVFFLRGCLILPLTPNRKEFS